MNTFKMAKVLKLCSEEVKFRPIWSHWFLEALSCFHNYLLAQTQADGRESRLDCSNSTLRKASYLIKKFVFRRINATAYWGRVTQILL